MHSTVIDMTKEPFWRNIIRFTIPLVLMSMLQILFMACDDMFILGLFVGSQALAAVGATTYIVNLFINGFAGLAVGVNVVSSQAIGAKNSEVVRKAVHTAISSSLILGIVVVAIGEFFARLSLEALNTPIDIIDESTLYLRIYFFSAPFNLIFNFASAIMRAKGDSRHPFLYLTLSGVVDIVLCTSFVLLFDLGVAGVAIGTLLSQVFAAILSVSYLLRCDDNTRLILKDLKIDLKIFKRILVIGVPTGLNNMAFSFSNMQIQSAINIFGSAAVAGCSVSTTMENFIYAATNSIMQAVISFTGQNVGAGKLDNVPKIVHLSLIYTFSTGTVLGALVYLSGYPLLPFFIDSDAIGYAMSRNLVAMLPYGLCGVMEVYAGVQRGLGKGLAPTIITLLGVCIFRVIWVYTAFRAVMTIEMLFLSYPISWSATAVAHYICYKRSLKTMERRAIR
ncbi:MAG TPA: MATE family efflux transporter [Candidatus Ornithospirochaeta stercorigallinarum]|nr:MATE family efflux transporter [Candidatus Ornithospirochaeta stercorigallinarum]